MCAFVFVLHSDMRPKALGFPAVDVWCPLLLHVIQNSERKEKGGGCVASLNGTMEEWTGSPHGPVPAAVALSQVTLRALTLLEAASYFFTKGRKKRVW